jgi:hypothetical protein
MFLLGWNMSDGNVVIHRKGCTHRKPSPTRQTGKPPFAQDQIEFGEQEYLSKEAFAYDYWNNGILQEYEAEHGEGTFDVFQGMNFQNCCDDLQLNEPEPEPVKGKKGKAKPKSERVTGYRAWATKPITSAMVGFTAWIAEAYPELDVDPNSDREMRLVMIASKAYGFYQGSLENKARNAALRDNAA